MVCWICGWGVTANSPPCLYLRTRRLPDVFHPRLQSCLSFRVRFPNNAVPFSTFILLVRSIISCFLLHIYDDFFRLCLISFFYVMSLRILLMLLSTRCLIACTNSCVLGYKFNTCIMLHVSNHFYYVFLYDLNKTHVHFFFLIKVLTYSEQ